MDKIAISIGDFQHMVGIGRTKTYQLINEKRIATIKIGRRRLVLTNSIDAFINDLNVNSPVAPPQPLMKNNHENVIDLNAYKSRPKN